MLEFARIQDAALNLENFDSIQAFPDCGGTSVLLVRFETIMKDARFRH